MTDLKQYLALSLIWISLIPVDERLVHHLVSAWSGVVARKIPVAWVVGNGVVQSFD